MSSKRARNRRKGEAPVKRSLWLVEERRRIVDGAMVPLDRHIEHVELVAPTGAEPQALVVQMPFVGSLMTVVFPDRMELCPVGYQPIVSITWRDFDVAAVLVPNGSWEPVDSWSGVWLGICLRSSVVPADIAGPPPRGLSVESPPTRPGEPSSRFRRPPIVLPVASSSLLEGDHVSKSSKKHWGKVALVAAAVYGAVEVVRGKIALPGAKRKSS